VLSRAAVITYFSHRTHKHIEANTPTISDYTVADGVKMW